MESRFERNIMRILHNSMWITSVYLRYVRFYYALGFLWLHA